MRRIQQPVILSIVALVVLGGCEQRQAAPEPEPADALVEAPAEPDAAPSATAGPTRAEAPAKPSSSYSIGEQSQLEVSQGLKAACEKGHKNSQPMLIEFSAPWCGDCRQLAELKQLPALKAKMEETPHFVVNIGRFDRHEGLVTDFKIRAIANWQVVGTDSCDAPVSTWKKIAGRTLEPRTGKKKVTEGDLVQWLDSHFGGQ